MNINKIFLIGCNKTASTFFHKKFLSVGLKSQHATNWNVDNYDCFSDNGDLQDLEFLYENFPDSIFILNTRPLIDWLISRVTHGYKYKQKWCYPFSKEKCLSWISNRDRHHSLVVDFFKKDKSKLFICNISRQKELCAAFDFLKLEIHSLKHKHKTPSAFKISEQDLFIIHECLEELNYSTQERETYLLKSIDKSNFYLNFYKK